jgi:8-oxo-dGTP diphosphatase
VNYGGTAVNRDHQTRARLLANNENEILAAGGVVCDAMDSPKVLVVHRPKYDDWSFPKGKAEPGETIEETALREVREETGLECRIIREAAVSRYRYRQRDGNSVPKVVHYFLMAPVNRKVPSVPGVEVDSAEWIEVGEASARLTHAADRDVLATVLASGLVRRPANDE